MSDVSSQYLFILVESIEEKITYTVYVRRLVKGGRWESVVWDE